MDLTFKWGRGPHGTCRASARSVSGSTGSRPGVSVTVEAAGHGRTQLSGSSATSPAVGSRAAASAIQSKAKADTRSLGRNSSNTHTHTNPEVGGVRPQSLTQRCGGSRGPGIAQCATVRRAGRRAACPPGFRGAGALGAERLGMGDVQHHWGRHMCRGGPPRLVPY